MHRFYVPNIGLSAGDVSLPPHVAQQVGRVLRLKPGEEIGLFDGSGREWPANLATVGKSSVTATLGDSFEPKVEPWFAVTMLLAPIRHERFELALQKVTELGASAIVPVVTDRVLGHEANVSDSRFERWERILVEAAEQSGRVKIPRLSMPTPLIEAVRTEVERGPVLVLWEETRSPGLLSEIESQSYGKFLQRLAIVVGPIGGLTAEEVESARAAGAVPVGLGDRILRSETAAIAALSIAMAELGQLGV